MVHENEEGVRQCSESPAILSTGDQSWCRLSFVSENPVLLIQGCVAPTSSLKSQAAYCMQMTNLDFGGEGLAQV